MSQTDRLRTRPSFVTGDIALQLISQRDELSAKVEELRDLMRRLLAKLPHETRDLSVGWCAGCHAVQWCGDSQGAEPCAPDCVLQEAKAVVGEK